VLGRRDVKSLKAEAGSFLGSVNTNAVSQATLEDGSTIYIVSREVILGRKNEILFPTLANPVINDLPSALVDMGAIPYVCNGANVMAPGIMSSIGRLWE